MNLRKKAASLLRSQPAKAVPTGMVHVYDPHPLNWLYITYNTVEELVRVAPWAMLSPQP